MKKEIRELFEKISSKYEYRHLRIGFYSDCSGYVQNNEEQLMSFDNEEELIFWLRKIIGG